MNAQQNAYVLPVELNQVLAVERISVSPTGEQPGQGTDFYAFVFDLGLEDAVNAFGGTPTEAVAKVLSLLGKPCVLAMTEQISSTTLSRVQQRIEMIANAADAQASQLASQIAHGYLLALRDEGLIDACLFAEFDEQIFEATGEWVANSLVEEGVLTIGTDGEKYWNSDSQVGR